MNEKQKQLHARRVELYKEILKARRTVLTLTNLVEESHRFYTLLDEYGEVCYQYGVEELKTNNDA